MLRIVHVVGFFFSQSISRGHILSLKSHKNEVKPIDTFYYLYYCCYNINKEGSYMSAMAIKERRFRVVGETLRTSFEVEADSNEKSLHSMLMIEEGSIEERRLLQQGAFVDV